ncbi:hypothetical protein RN347_16745 [Halomonas sp. PAMB 3264]|uniref:hypothetical protein n=1 Tax=Halomonas sp. PAMB 3264 TaxID=3075222 RepID=UPI0028970E39|nr:hypothetical protein [Halomonas sp. PAMB 3264]WNL42245.1 hypothetical protein RN347_16745 [Halomonas sp. PAMB 3264]
MPETITLARHIDAEDARERLARLGGSNFEPAWISLWAFGLGALHCEPAAWLLASQALARPLLLPHTALTAQAEKPSDELTLDGGQPPEHAPLSRQWFWERMASPKRWPLTLKESPPTLLWLPCWLGYTAHRQRRLLVLSGLSGQALPQLKPLVLSALKRRAREGQRQSEGVLEESGG